ncbi:ABC transporter permease [Hymenobacter sp. BT523]|uniref:ABC transporter permease/M1 family aminopeptidase n=1 Tax=Hymenobacter sp. BT523 TaxID=2795725 RepID=UPI0018ED9DAE|nr:M1 family aminopeptidase [Hymenobacter sp. BT523]MBJ6111004.1 ABC transporter permease [Hymenobacter sp. BT523]
MFLPIFLFELKYRLRRPATWIYFGVLLVMAALLSAAAGGIFGSGANVSLGGDGGRVHVNSPHSIAGTITILSLFGVIITSALMGNPVYRDFEHRTFSLFYTKPISKLGYLGGRFLGSFVICLLVFSGLALGLFVGGLLPGVEADKFGPYHLSYYLWPYVVYVIPNLLFTGAVFFTLATLTRNILSTYIGSVLLLVAYLIAQSFIRDLDNVNLAAALDTFGSTASYYTTRYWTAAEKNTLLVPFSRYLVLNRVLWVGAALALLGLCYARFQFSAFASDKAPSKKARAAAQADALPAAAMGGRLVLPRVAQLFTRGMNLRQYWSLTKLEFRGIVRSVYFAAIVGAGVIFILAIGWQVGKMYDTSTYPVTAEMVEVLSGNFSLFILIIITYYAGELVWRERDAGVAQITDALPVPNWVPFLSKLSALGLVQVVLLAVVMACGLLLQTLKGYFHYEPGLYLESLFGFKLIDFLLLCVLAMLVQVIVNNKYLGHFVMLVYYLATLFQSQLGINHHLLDYAGNPGTPYSDMNGYGHFVTSFSWFKLYWAAGALLLALAANIFWVRGTDAAFVRRRAEASHRWGRPAWTALALGLLVMLGAGGFIFYNTNVENVYRTPKEVEKLQLGYEQKYRRYKDLPQPRLVAVNLKTDLYPATRQVHIDGHFWLKNRHARALDTVIIQVPQEARVRQLTLGRPAATLALNDSAVNLRLYRLARPLAPGDSLEMTAVLDFGETGFPNSGSNTDIVQNGIFMNSATYLPGIGYNEQGELGDDDVRKRNGLKPKDRLAPATDLKARQNSGLSQDADWIRFETVVSTSADQLAVAPGRLLKDWTQGNRRYFHYKMEQPMLNFYTFLSARYKVYKDAWQDSAGRRAVPIEIYYQPGHEYNLKRMAQAVKESFAYYTKHFGPYQHPQVRILEFPKYASFAQSFAGTIPFSESIGFIAKVDPNDPEDVDYPFYVTAHEVAHQWWGHQIVGGNVQGETMLVETMAQYSALMVMKHHYGPYTMGKFLDYELNSYLSGRAFERKKEVPLAKVEGQGYIHYRKGSVVMYALQDYIGEDQVNAALHSFLEQHKYETAPYTTAPQLVAEFRKVTPDSLQNMVTDLFDRITLYENRLTDASVKKLPNGQFQVRMTVQSKKLVADSLGTERPGPENDYLPVAIFPAQGNDQKPVPPLLLTKRRFHAGTNKLEFVVAKEPAKVAVDPYHEFVDRVVQDNTKDVAL